MKLSRETTSGIGSAADVTLSQSVDVKPMEVDPATVVAIGQHGSECLNFGQRKSTNNQRVSEDTTPNGADTHSDAKQLSPTNAVRLAYYSKPKEPHHGIYFMPGKVEGKGCQFLLDTGCSTNILSKRMFNLLQPSTRNRLIPINSIASLADGSSLDFEGQLTVHGRIREVPFQEEFLVGNAIFDK